MRQQFIFGLFCVIFLTSCTTEEKLSSDKVISRASRANQDLRSANFTIDTSYSVPFNMLEGTIRGNANIDGILQDSGEIMRILVQAEASTDDMQIQTDFEAVITSGDETYIKILTMDTQPTYPLLTPDIVSSITNRWWEFPAKNSKQREIMPTPDPKLLQAQSQVISVIDDMGFDTIRKRRVYRYKVEVDREKLYDYLTTLSKDNSQDADEADISAMLDGLNAFGELWIDAETFYLQRIFWTIETLSPQTNKPIVISFTMDLTDHNDADSIVFPTDKDLFTVEELLPLLDISSTSSFPDFPSELENEIIKKLSEETQKATPSP